MDNYFKLLDTIDEQTLFKRWPGMTDTDLAEMVINKVLPAYFLVKTLKDPETGSLVYFCSPAQGPTVHWEGSTPLYYWHDEPVFEMKDVQRIEAEHPEYLWESISDAEERDETASKTVDSNSKPKPSGAVSDVDIRVIVRGILALKANWEALPEQSSKRKHGYSQKEIDAFLPGITRSLQRKVKIALDGTEIKVRMKRGARPS